MRLRRTGFIVVLLMLALVVAACGGKKEEQTSGGAAETVEIVIEMGRPGAEFSFNPSEIELKVNQPVRLVAKNLGSVPHDLHIPEFGVSIGPVPAGGEASATFTPNKVGEFAMECHEPGHLASGMVGTVKVVQ